MWQSVRRHSATVLTSNVSGMQEIHPVIFRLLERNQVTVYDHWVFHRALVRI